MRAWLASHWAVPVLIVLMMSFAAFCMMGMDKRRAQKAAWRIPEKTLWLIAILGGGPGACLGMWTFHHKTRHWYFQYGFPLLALTDLVLLGWLLLG